LFQLSVFWGRNFGNFRHINWETFGFYFSLQYKFDLFFYLKKKVLKFFIWKKRKKNTSSLILKVFKNPKPELVWFWILKKKGKKEGQPEVINKLNQRTTQCWNIPIWRPATPRNRSTQKSPSFLSVFSKRK
jgi:hypothetical protein